MVNQPVLNHECDFCLNRETNKTNEKTTNIVRKSDNFYNNRGSETQFQIYSGTLLNNNSEVLLLEFSFFSAPLSFHSMTSWRQILLFYFTCIFNT